MLIKEYLVPGLCVCISEYSHTENVKNFILVQDVESYCCLEILSFRASISHRDKHGNFLV
jgi:hypothetical protein